MEEQQEKTQDKKLWKIFWSTFYLSAFTFGGGYVIVSLMKKKFVDEYHWIEEEEMLDLVAIAQSAPGAIAVNGSHFAFADFAICAMQICHVLVLLIKILRILSGSPESFQFPARS